MFFILNTVNSREFSHPRVSVHVFYKVYSDTLLARTLNSRGNQFANYSENEILANITGSTVLTTPCFYRGQRFAYPFGRIAKIIIVRNCNAITELSRLKHLTSHLKQRKRKKSVISQSSLSFGQRKSTSYFECFLRKIPSIFKAKRL